MKRARPLLLACALLCGLGAVRADDYPSKSLRLIVPFAAGGAVGAVARVLSAPLSAGLGQSIVIDNRGGAGGIIGMDAVAKSSPDGYTLLLVHSGLTYMPGLYRKLPFDPEKDFDGIVTAVSGSHALAVSTASPFKTVAELIAYAKANPGKLTYGSAGIGSTLHLAAEFFKRATGVDILHVPYKGAAQATTDLVGGQVQMMFGPLVAIMPLAEAGP
jgi:tripartite-type tricarboxylate transporter receptor subunit TctC